MFLIDKFYKGCSILMWICTGYAVQCATDRYMWVQRGAWRGWRLSTIVGRCVPCPQDRVFTYVSTYHISFMQYNVDEIKGEDRYTSSCAHLSKR